MGKFSYCKKCGYMLFPEDKVCPRCGHSLIKKKKKHSWLIYLIPILPLILIMSGVCGFYLLDGKNENSGGAFNNTPSTSPAQTPDLSGAQEETSLAVSEPDETENTEFSEQETADLFSGSDEEGYSEDDEDENSGEYPQETPPQYQTALSEPDKYGHAGMIPPKFTAYKASSAAEDVYSAAHAFDADMNTVWGTGGDNGGIGEWITLSADEYQSVSGVRIYNGNTRSEQDFKENARVKIVEVSFSDGSYIRRILQDGFSRNEPQIIRFEGRINTKYLKITILDKYGDSDTVCIGEISVF